MEKPNDDRVTLKTLFICGIIVMAATATLRQMGRQWWCDCGSPVSWSWDIYSSHNSQHLVDPYSFTHVLHGVLFFGAFYFLRGRLSKSTRLMTAVIVESCWEILENSPMIIERYRAATISLDYYGDSVANSLSDIVACALGYLFASRVRWWWSLALVLVVELVLLVTIRDCLTLNVVMLLYPIEAIKEWQGS